MADLNGTTWPDKIFFCGVPGSRWSGIAQEIKAKEGMNISDRASHRVYKHGKFGGHIDAYFGTGMEFSCKLSEENLRYESDYWMRAKIEEQNNLILDFAQRNNLSWKQHHKHRNVFITTCLNYS